MTRTLRALLELMDAPRRLVAAAVALGATAVLFGVGLMATAGYLISRAAERPAVLSLMVAIVAVRFFGLARPIARYGERVVAHDTALRVLARARRHVYERIEPLAPAQLAGYRDGDLLSRFAADVDALQDLHVRALEPAAVAAAVGIVCVGAAAVILPGAALVLAVGLLLAATLPPAAAWAADRRRSRGVAAARGELTAELVELLTGAPELLVCGAADERLQRLGAADARVTASARTAAVADGLGDALRIALTGATVAAVLAAALHAHALARLDGVLIAALALLALASFEAVQPLTAAARQLGASLAAGRRVLEVTEVTPRITDPARPAELPAGPLPVALDGVRAAYGDGEPVPPRPISLRLEAGSRVALLGPSGAGKTTIANLLLRFLDPVEGRITLAGRDLREYRQADVRAAIAVVPQEPHLFSTSIRENVRLARPNATDEDVEEALRRAGVADQVLRFPNGLDTHVGELGRELSGGQRQRIAVARALLADARILVLDEPTAHLDQGGARALVEDVFAGAGDRPVLLITHRTEGLELVDDVHVLRT